MGQGAQKIGELSVKLADAALIARERGDDVKAIFFAIKAAETLAIAKALGWKPELLEPSASGKPPTGDDEAGGVRNPGGGHVTEPH